MKSVMRNEKWKLIDAIHLDISDHQDGFRTMESIKMLGIYGQMRLGKLLERTLSWATAQILWATSMGLVMTT